MAFLEVMRPRNVNPTCLSMKDNVFWANDGPDLLPDLAGKSRLAVQEQSRGEDLFRTLAGRSLLQWPGVCQSFDLN